MASGHSKLPDLKEIGSITGKFFSDIKKSVCEIVKEYQEKRQTAAPSEKHAKAASNKPAKAPKVAASTRAKAAGNVKKTAPKKKEE